MKKNSLIVIVGPTAVGKTAIAIELAKQFNTEIISADSRQIFKEMTIGTAKPSDDEINTIPHHFINSHSINEAYDAAQYGRDALVLINELFKKHKILILCGGSGLYIKAVLEGFDEIPEVPESVREELNHNYEREGLTWLQNKMKELDPDHFNIIDQQNPHRLIRALEVRMSTGQSIATFQKKAKLKHDFNVIKIGLEVERDELYHRIDSRMDKMIEAGLFEEAEALYKYKDHQALQTVGYQEIFDFMDGQYDRDEAIRLLKRNSRRYAKRQLTWFKRDEEIKWFAPDSLPILLNWLNGIL
ncbi:MAG TPA: tRNA (adenosine(37)-N6)-dimethylallyltransferase MiaA [Cyclobacteriaceae bacterium]